MAITVIGSNGGNGVIRLLIKNSIVSSDCADHIAAQVSGTALRIVGVLRKAIAADLEVQIILTRIVPTVIDHMPLATVTIPASTAQDVPVVFTTFAISKILQDDVLSFAILSSDSQSDPDGVASLTLEWS